MKSNSQRMQQLTPHFFATLSARIAALQAAGKDIIRLDEGSPDLPPAAHILAALAQSAAEPSHHSYQTHRGPASLRLAWAGMYQRLYGVELDPESEIIPLLGSKEGIFHLSLAVLDPGDIALVPDPGYITYSRGALFAGAEVYPVPLLAEQDYLPDLAAIPSEVLRRARLLWLNYPNNPTAALATRQFFTQAVEFARQHDLLICHDAAYSQVTFDGYRPPSPFEIPGAKEVLVEFNSLSKSHNMAGWRIGAALGNPQVLKALHTLKTNADSSHFLPILEAATQAMTADQGWLVERNEIYRQRRDIVLAGLHAVGLNPATPLASLYVWSPLPAGYTSSQFAIELLEQASVSVTPGIVFGQHGEGYMRIALCSPAERIDEAMRRVRLFLTNARKASP